MRGWLTGLCLLGVAGLAHADDADAKKLYRAYAETVAEARTLKIVYKQETTVQKKPQTVEGTLLLGEGNRLHWEQTGADEFLFVGDNKTWAMTGLRGGESKPQALPDHSRRSILTLFTPGYLSLELALMQIGSPKEVALPVGISGLKSKGTEKVGDKEATLLTYKLELTSRSSSGLLS